MSKFYISFLIITIFLIGISLGMYFSYDKNVKGIENESVAIKDSMQDIVIRKVQEEREDNIIETIESEIKVSPYAKIIVEKDFSKCNHTSVDIIDVPKELINLTQNEFIEKYKNWEIKKFESDTIEIYRKLDTNCSSHFVIKDTEGYLTVYKELTDETLELKEHTDIEVSSLREEDQNKLQSGIKIYGKEELSSIIEDFNS